MWNDEEFISKSRLYFSRARVHSIADDETVTLWLLLGLEFLLRAPLARVHPSLLADPKGDAIMYALDLPVRPNSQLPTSIQTNMVITRLGTIVQDFYPGRANDATFLVGLRNSELHSSSASLHIDSDQWLPHFTRVVEVLCHHLGLDATDMVGAELIDQGRALVDRADKRLEHEIAERIAKARAFFGRLRPDELEARRALLSTPASHLVLSAFPDALNMLTADHPFEGVNCPSCGEYLPMRVRPVRWTNERLEGRQLVRDIVCIAVELTCPVCDLHLRNTEEIRAAKMQQQYVQRRSETLAERFAGPEEA